MAKKERQRRSARQARSQERERMAADAASDEATTSSTKAVQSSLQPSRKHSKSDAKKANGGRIKPKCIVWYGQANLSLRIIQVPLFVRSLFAGWLFGL